jgi:excisionase family DNA binding protein
MKEKLMTIKQVAKELTISPKTVYGWVERREVPHLRIGGAIRFAPEVVRGLVKSVEVG